MSKRHIHLITTGGTIEKRYVEAMGTMVNTEPQIRRCLSLLRLPDTDITVEELMNKDSLLMTDEDRATIAAAVHAALKPGVPVVITHGTDAMVQSGHAIEASMRECCAAPVILTGAMTPFGIEGSDALQNLTESLLASSLLQPGVYIVFHGEVFPIHNVKKDIENSRFVRVTP